MLTWIAVAPGRGRGRGRRGLGPAPLRRAGPAAPVPLGQLLPRRPTRDQVEAVHVLTHEAMHLSGRLEEAAAECAAVQRDAHTARLLGAPAAAYWRDVYPLMPDGYRSADCRPGGTLDDGLTDAPWLARTSS